MRAEVGGEKGHTPRTPVMPIQAMDDRISVRRAEVSDAPGLSVLYRRFLRSYGHDSEPQAIVRFLERLLRESWVIFFVATDESAGIVGFAGCSLSYSAISRSVAVTINDLFVDLPARRRGVATALCGAIEAYATSNGFVKVFVQTAPEAKAAIALYTKLGFDPEPYRAMTKELPDV